MPCFFHPPLSRRSRVSCFWINESLDSCSDILQAHGGSNKSVLRAATGYIRPLRFLPAAHQQVVRRVVDAVRVHAPISRLRCRSVGVRSQKAA
jgi:hypothetical protein